MQITVEYYKLLSQMQTTIIKCCRKFQLLRLFELLRLPGLLGLLGSWGSLGSLGLSGLCTAVGAFRQIWGWSRASPGLARGSSGSYRNNKNSGLVDKLPIRVEVLNSFKCHEPKRVLCYRPGVVGEPLADRWLTVS